MRRCDVKALKPTNGMLGILLIPIENGRGVKTYGVKYYNNIHNIMKNIICLFILTIVCVNCVHGDIEFYPGMLLSML